MPSLFSRDTIRDVMWPLVVKLNWQYRAKYGLMPARYQSYCQLVVQFCYSNEYSDALSVAAFARGDHDSAAKP